jgi:hypothetical protein
MSAHAWEDITLPRRGVSDIRLSGPRVNAAGQHRRATSDRRGRGPRRFPPGRRRLSAVGPARFHRRPFPLPPHHPAAVDQPPQEHPGPSAECEYADRDKQTSLDAVPPDVNLRTWRCGEVATGVYPDWHHRPRRPGRPRYDLAPVPRTVRSAPPRPYRQLYQHRIVRPGISEHGVLLQDRAHPDVLVGGQPASEQFITVHRVPGAPSRYRADEQARQGEKHRQPGLDSVGSAPERIAVETEMAHSATQLHPRLPAIGHLSGLQEAQPIVAACRSDAIVRTGGADGGTSRSGFASRSFGGVVPGTETPSTRRTSTSRTSTARTTTSPGGTLGSASR